MGENSKKIKEYIRQLESLSKALIDYKIDENFFKKSVYRKLGMVYAHHVEIDKNIPLTIFRSRKANEIKNEEDLKKTSSFSYIPIEITSDKRPPLGRLNYTGQSVFYGSLSAQTNFREIDKEIQPHTIVYTSLWRLKKNARLNCYSVYHSEQHNCKNNSVNNNVVDADLEVYLRVLGEEFLRNDFVDDRRYYISSVVGNHILNFCPSSSKVRKPLYDAVLYSSVVADKDNVFNKNIAMFPNIVDSSLDFYCVLKGELLEDLQTIRPLFIGRVEKSIIEWYKISVIVDLSNIHIVGVMHNGEREMFENEEEEPKSLFKIIEENVLSEKGFEIQNISERHIKNSRFTSTFEYIKPDFNEMNPFSYLYDMPMEKEYFKNYRGFEGVVLKIDGSINYTPVELSEVLSE